MRNALNLDFEQASVVTATHPWGWYTSDLYDPQERIRVSLDSTVRHHERRSLRVERDAAAWFAEQSLEAGRFGGKRFRLSGWVRTKALQEGTAAFYATLWRGPSQSVDTIRARGVSGTMDWTRIVMEGAVDTAVRFLTVGVELSGTGTAWFDELVLEVDGERIFEDPDRQP